MSIDRMICRVYTWRRPEPEAGHAGAAAFAASHGPRTALATAFAISIALACSTPSGGAFTPESFSPEGDYEHVITGLWFPLEIGPYRRTHVSRYDPDSLDVSGHYELSGSEWGLATVYHYPASADGSFPTWSDLEAQFDQAKKDIVLVHSSATLLSESDDEVFVNGLSLLGRRAVFSLDLAQEGAAEGPGRDDGPIVSSLYLYALENWLLKFRFSHHEIDSDHVSQSERRFIEAIRWPIPDGALGREDDPTCIAIANLYEKVSRMQDEGYSREEQVEMIDGPEEDESDRAAHAMMMHAVVLAAAHPELTSLQLRSLILRDCTRDEDGRIRLPRFWTPSPDDGEPSSPQ